MLQFPRYKIEKIELSAMQLSFCFGEIILLRSYIECVYNKI